MNFAVIKTGGKQYKVSANDVVKVEKLAGEPGDVVTFDQVLMVGEGAEVKVGAPLITGGKVEGKVVAQGKADKIMIVKFRRRKHYRRQKGHRQAFTEVEITSISDA